MTVYRIVEANPPTDRDMQSYAALGRKLRDTTPEAVRLAQGISVFATAERAAHIAQRSPWLGEAYIATLEVPTGQFHIEQTGRRGHYTIWGEPHDILGTVTHVAHALQVREKETRP